VNTEESERDLRIASLMARATALFNNNAGVGRNWMTRPQPTPGDAVPVTLARTEAGAREGEHALLRLEDGVFG
jgi:putative toxin-antitoxin system antitoxin component (TIGR02293 family)